jgi:hypothetical protein
MATNPNNTACREMPQDVSPPYWCQEVMAVAEAVTGASSPITVRKGQLMHEDGHHLTLVRPFIRTGKRLLARGMGAQVQHRSWKSGRLTTMPWQHRCYTTTHAES